MTCLMMIYLLIWPGMFTMPNLAQQSIVFDRLMQQQTTSNQQLINELREVGNIIDRKNYS